jgi:hypothetical protein
LKNSFRVAFDSHKDEFVILPHSVIADDEIEGGMWQIVLSTNVNSERGAGWLGKIKGFAKTIMNRIYRKQKVDQSVINQINKGGAITGWSIGRLFDGRYYDQKTGEKFDEKSFSIEIRGIDEQTARKVASALLKAFKQQSVLLVDLKTQRTRLLYAKAGIAPKSAIPIYGYKYQDLHHGAGSVIWWIDGGKLNTHISKGTMKDMHHELSDINMDRVWRGRSDKMKGGMVTVLPPVQSYMREAEDIPSRVLDKIEAVLKPRGIIVDTMYGLQKVGFTVKVASRPVETH